MPLSRRSFFTTSALAGAGIAGTSSAAMPAVAATPASATGVPAGARRPGPLRDDPKGLLALPEGFAYTVVAESGVTVLESGQKTPERTDGTGAFRVGGRTRLVQNHEIGPKSGSAFPVPAISGTVYDAGIPNGSGGATVVELDAAGHRAREWVGLSGTISNCAGGVTPWGTWLSCEETEDKRGTVYPTPVGQTHGPQTAQQDHGFVFEVDPAAPSAEQHPQPIRAWGRFAHEAVVVRDGGATAYLTEDASARNGLLYRWTAPRGLRCATGVLQDLAPGAGTLEAMRVTAPDGGHLDDLSRITSQHVGTELAVAWVTVPDRAAATTSTRLQFQDSEITRSKKLEGAWGDAHGVWFAASFAHPGAPTPAAGAISDGDVPVGSTPHDGQLWYYDCRSQTLTLKLYLPYLATLHDPAIDPRSLRGTGVTLLDGPDNVHVSPFGGIVLAEDGDGDQHIVGWTQATGAFPLARNEINGAEDGATASYSEMTGPTFSPDGRTLFANVQEPGHTFAITGPFERYLR